MTPHAATAPGKIMLAGEYAVLDGAPCALVAINRRATAHVAVDAQDLSPFLAAARDELTDPDALARAARVVVDTTSFADPSGAKLGLGSSAAATVSAVACALQSDDPARVHAIAHRAHANAQGPRGARGSGADVAASVYGGVVIVRRGDGAPLAVTRSSLPPGLSMVPVWTGTAADTPTLVATVRALRATDPSAYAAATARIAGAAARFVDALGPTGSAAHAVDALRAGGDAARGLGDAAGAALWTAAHSQLRDAVEPLGGAVKPTGAGGGDIALAVFATGCDADARAALADAGIVPLALNVDSKGVRLS